MTPTLLLYLLIAFASAIAVHLVTRLLIGERADPLWGGALAVGLIQGMTYAKTVPETPSWVLNAVFICVAALGHLLSTRMVMRFYPRFGVRKKT